MPTLTYNLLDIMVINQMPTLTYILCDIMVTIQMLV